MEESFMHGVRDLLYLYERSNGQIDLDLYLPKLLSKFAYGPESERGMSYILDQEIIDYIYEELSDSLGG